MPEPTQLQSTQLPAAGEVFLDHLAHFVPDMASAAEAMAQLGFRLTPYTVQTNSAADGKTTPSGTANRCAMLHRGYIELLTKSSDTPLGRQLSAALARYTGVHLVALSSANAEGEHARLEQAGFAPLPVVHLSRAAPGGTASFTVVRVPPERMPEGRIQFLTHHTEAAIWTDATPGIEARAGTANAHPNRVSGLTAAMIAVADPAAVADRFGRFARKPPHRVAPGWHRLTLDRGALHFLDTSNWNRLLPGTAPSAPPQIGAYVLRTAEPQATRAWIAAQGLDIRTLDNTTFAVAAPAALGGMLVFAAAEWPPATSEGN